MIIVIILTTTIEYRKQVIHSAIAYHLLTKELPAQPWPTPPSFIIQHDSMQYGISLWPVRVNCPNCVSSQSLRHSSLLAEGVQSGKQRNPDLLQALLSDSQNTGALSTLLQTPNITPQGLWNKEFYPKQTQQKALPKQLSFKWAMLVLTPTFNHHAFLTLPFSTAVSI